MSEVDLALQDESQQYGNLDEAAAIARMPHISVWLSGLVTTGKPQVASVKPNLQRKFRQKLLRRPVTLRGDSYKVQPNALHKVLARYLTETPLSPTYPVAKLFDEGPYLSPVAAQQLQAIKNSWGVMMTGSLALFLALHSLSCGWLCTKQMWTIWSL